MLVIEMHAPWAGFVCVRGARCTEKRLKVRESPRVVLPTLAWLLMRPFSGRRSQFRRLDLYFASTLRMFGALALMFGPVLALVAATLTSLKSPQRIDAGEPSDVSKAQREESDPRFWWRSSSRCTPC